MGPLQASRRAFSTACSLSRAHTTITSEALKTYGDHGPQISGCMREHFPEPLKEALRALAAGVNAQCDAAYAARPRGVHRTTIRKLGQEVARAEGCGFYGPMS